MAEENETFIEDDSIVLDDIEEDVAEDSQTENIIPFIMERFHRAEDYRRQDEERWLRSYRNYRGIYGPQNYQMVWFQMLTLIHKNQNNCVLTAWKSLLVHMVFQEMDVKYLQVLQLEHLQKA